MEEKPKLVGCKTSMSESIFELEDGGVLKIKVVVKKVIRTGKKNNMGVPIYHVEFQPIVTVDTPEELRGDFKLEAEVVQPKETKKETNYHG